MNEQPFDPMKELGKVGKLIERGFQSAQQAVQQAMSSSTLRVDVYVLDGAVILRTAPLDGLVADSVEVNMEDKVLTVSGETRPEDIAPDVQFIAQERRFGPFSRSVTIPIPVKSGEAKAKLLKEGVIIITLPIDTDQYQDIQVTPTE